MLGRGTRTQAVATRAARRAHVTELASKTEFPGAPRYFIQDKCIMSLLLTLWGYFLGFATVKAQILKSPSTASAPTSSSKGHAVWQSPGLPRSAARDPGTRCGGGRDTPRGISPPPLPPRSVEQTASSSERTPSFPQAPQFKINSRFLPNVTVSVIPFIPTVFTVFLTKM